MIYEGVKILLVEDNPGDARLTKEALADGKVKVEMFHVEDGADAISFLKQEDEYSNCPRPDLILLDLNLPNTSGHEVLEELQTMNGVSSIPVVVLTSSEDERDIDACYKLKANCFVSKPVDFETFVKVISAIDEFWFSVVKLPQTA